MKPRVLVVDDDKDHAEGIADLLELRGYKVEVAFSGEQAIDRFGEADFDVTLMDVKLPGMNGVETFLQFRKARPAARVVMMTAHSVDELIERADHGGAVATLHKPFSMDDLLRALKRAEHCGPVLIVAADAEFAENTAGLFANKGNKIEISRSGQDAIDKLLSMSFDCVVLDRRMPDLSGTEVSRRFFECGRAAPLIISM